MKKLLALILALAMVLSLVACGSSSSSSSSSASDAEDTSAADTADDAQEADDSEDASDSSTAVDITPYVIGFPEAPVEIAAIQAIKYNTEKVAQAAGGTMSNEVFDFTPEGTVDAVEKMIANGVSGVKITPSSESIIPTILNMCEEAGVYFILSMRTIEDEDIRAMCEASEYYLGCVYEDDYAVGYALGKALAESGATTYALIGTSVGDTTGDTREAGLAAAAEEFGLTQVAEVRALEQASDATQAVESFLAAYPDLGGIIRIASTAAGDVSAICVALEEAGRGNGDVKFVTVDSDDDSAQYLESGTLTMTMGNVYSIDSFISTVILVNAICGTPISDEPVYICVAYPELTSVDELNAENTYIISEDGLYPETYIKQNFLKMYNSSLTLDDILNELELYSPDYIATLWD